MSDPSYIDDPYPFESDDDIEIRELDLESVDAFADERVTVGDVAGTSESWRYGHVIVDEAQDLTAMQWRMIMRRVRGRSITVVGDLAQRSQSTAGSWEELLPPELHGSLRQDLTVNYRSPVEIHALAVAVLADFAPDVAPSTAIRAAERPPVFERVRSCVAALPAIVNQALADVGGQVAVIGIDVSPASFDPGAHGGRLSVLAPNEAKGLEFDAVVLVEPAQIWHHPGGPSQLYIALTRATQQLVVVHEESLPPVLQSV